MDEKSRNAILFLEALQDAHIRIFQLQSHYKRCGLHPERPYLWWGARPNSIGSSGKDLRVFLGMVEVGLNIKGVDDLEYSMSVETLWDEDKWTIITWAWRESTENEGSDLLRECPERVATDLAGCIQELHAAIDDLLTFDDLVPFERSEG